jgi:hypothetical protein
MIKGFAENAIDQSQHMAGANPNRCVVQSAASLLKPPFAKHTRRGEGGFCIEPGDSSLRGLYFQRWLEFLITWTAKAINTSTATILTSRSEVK